MWYHQLERGTLFPLSCTLFQLYRLVFHQKIFLCCVCTGRDFAYVARDRVTRRHMCHVFRCDTPARTIANTLRDICKKIMIERNLQHGFSKAPESGNGIAIDFLSLSLYIFGILLSDGIVSPIRHSILPTGSNMATTPVAHASGSLSSSRSRPSNLPSEQRRHSSKIGQILLSSTSSNRSDDEWGINWLLLVFVTAHVV